VFGYILENSLKNVLQCLEQRKMKRKEKKNQKPNAAIPPPQSTINPSQTTIEKPTNPPSQQNSLNQNQEQTKTNKSKSTNYHNHKQHRFLAHEHVGERDGGTSTSTPVLGDREHEHTGSRRVQIWGGFNRGAASITDHRDQIWGGFDRWSLGPDLGWLRSRGGFDLGRFLESHRAALNHKLTDLINRLVGSGSGAAKRERAEKESREREQRRRA
jgi:hypothetical protein